VRYKQSLACPGAIKVRAESTSTSHKHISQERLVRARRKIKDTLHVGFDEKIAHNIDLRLRDEEFRLEESKKERVISLKV
jgi:hypothetical protein